MSQTNKNTWVAQVEEDTETGELVLPLPDELLNQVGWDFGDTLVWEELDNGNWSLRKKEGDKNGD